MKKNINLIFMTSIVKKLLTAYENMLLESQNIYKKIVSQVEGFALRVVELLFKVSMLPLYALVLFQHANNQQMLSPVAYPLYAGDKITVFFKKVI
tara:strand:- start:227 stop:511 length:285 start_codon:yes stop_codon:yes gene_type:complete